MSHAQTSGVRDNNTNPPREYPTGDVIDDYEQIIRKVKVLEFTQTLNFFTLWVELVDGRGSFPLENVPEDQNNMSFTTPTLSVHPQIGATYDLLCERPKYSPSTKPYRFVNLLEEPKPIPKDAGTHAG